MVRIDADVPGIDVFLDEGDMMPGGDTPGVAPLCLRGQPNTLHRIVGVSRAVCRCRFPGPVEELTDNGAVHSARPAALVLHRSARSPRNFALTALDVLLEHRV